jgi:hypothetical protein
MAVIILEFCGFWEMYIEVKVVPGLGIDLLIYLIVLINHFLV